MVAVGAASEFDAILLRAEPRRATMLVVAMVGGIAMFAFLGVMIVVEGGPLVASAILALLCALPAWGIVWARKMKRNLSLEIGRHGLVYRAASGLSREVAFAAVERVEVLTAPTMHAANVAGAVAGGAVGGALGRGLIRTVEASTRDAAAPAVVPVRIKVWSKGVKRPLVIPTDNLRHEESLDIVPLLLARGIASDAITIKTSKKRTLRS